MKRDHGTTTTGSLDLKRKKKNKRDQSQDQASSYPIATGDVDDVDVTGGQMLTTESSAVDHVVETKKKKSKKIKVDENSCNGSDQRDGINDESIEPSRDVDKNIVTDESSNSNDIDVDKKKKSKKINAADTKVRVDGSANSTGDEQSARPEEDITTADTAAAIEVKSSIFSGESFESLPLSSNLQKALKSMNFSKMTQIQAKSIPECLAGSDLIGAAKTGR
jgi:hypothetical protein